MRKTKTQKATQTPKAPQAQKTPQIPFESMQISDNCVKLVAKFEGCQLKAYKCPAGVWTIGYGHTEGVKPNDTLPSKNAAKNLLKRDLAKYADYVNQYRKNGVISFPVNQNMFDALTSFVYNCGNGSLKNLTENRDAATVAEKMLLYCKGGKKVLKGLERRRKAERRLFLKK